MRHLAIVTETYPPEINGVALTLSRLVAGLRARGHLVSLVRPRRPILDDALDAPAEDTTLVAGAPVPGYAGVRLGLPAGALLRARWRTDRPDAVYVATPGPLGWSALRAARDLDVPVWSGFHTNFHRYARHYHAGWLGRLVQGGLRRFHNATDGTMVPTVELRNELVAAGFRRLHVLGRGVDVQRFAPAHRSSALRARWGAGEADVVVAYVGRVASEKNIGLALEGYRAMRAAAPVGPFVVVGDGPLRGALERAHPGVVFAGMQAGEALAEHYASADVFLFPSETETFGNVILEAMASGLAIVAYDYAAARAHLHDGETALLAPRGAARVFVDRAVMLARLPETGRALGRRARDAANAADWPGIVSRFETLLLSPTRPLPTPHAVLAST